MQKRRLISNFGLFISDFSRGGKSFRYRLLYKAHLLPIPTHSGTLLGLSWLHFLLQSMRRQNITEFFGGYLWVSVGVGTGRKVCLKSVLVETPGKDPAAEICTRHPSLAASLPCPRGPHTPNNSQSTSRHPIPKR